MGVFHEWETRISSLGLGFTANLQLIELLTIFGGENEE